MEKLCSNAFFAARPVLLGFLLSIFVIPIAFAVHDEDFELDNGTTGGNIINDENLPVDWANLFDVIGDAVPTAKNPLPANFGVAGFFRDFVPGAKGPDTSSYTGGSSDVNDISTWSCTRSNNIGNKFNILNAYTTAYSDPGSGDTILYFALERRGNEGTASVGFWFLKDGTVSCEHPSGGGSTGFTGNHENGDLFIVSEFSSGGKVGEIKAYQWAGGAGGVLNSTPVAGGGDCSDALAGDNICATVNLVKLFGKGAGTDIPWLTETKQPGNTPSNDLDARLFFEGGINLTGAGLDACFATFQATTRSSTSLTSALHDYVTGNFPLCKIELSKQCGTGSYNPSTGNIDIPYSVTVNNTGSSTVTNVQAMDNDCGFGAGTTLNFGSVSANTQETLTGTCSVPEDTDLSSGITNGVTATAGGGVTVDLAATCATVGSSPGVCFSSCSFNLTPQIDVTKDCVMRLAQDDASSPIVLKSLIAGVVTNTSDQDQFDTCDNGTCTLGDNACTDNGDCTAETIPAAPVPLENVMVVDDNGTPSIGDDVLLTLFDTCDSGTCVISGDSCSIDTDCSEPSRLEPGQNAYYETDYLPTVLNDTCPARASFTDTVTASGDDVFTGNSVTDYAMATCDLCDESDCPAQ